MKCSFALPLPDLFIQPCEFFDCHQIPVNFNQSSLCCFAYHADTHIDLNFNPLPVAARAAGFVHFITFASGREFFRVPFCCIGFNGGASCSLFFTLPALIKSKASRGTHLTIRAHTHAFM